MSGPFKIRIISRRPLATRLDLEMRRSKQAAALESAHAANKLASKRVRDGRRPDGSAQRPNAASTVRKKGHNRALTDSGTLGRESSWGVEEGAQSVRSVPPPGYVRIIQYLARQDYPIISDPDPELHAIVQRIFEKHARAMRLGSTVQRRVIR